MSRTALRPVTLVLAAGLVLSSVAAAQTPGLTDHPAWEPENPRATSHPQTPSASADEPAAIAERLFAALLDREPSGLELEQAASQIDTGQRDALLGTLLGSSEYRRLRSTKTPNTLLDQYFAGLFDRSPDASAYRTFSGELSRGNDAGVVRALLDSPEFDDVIAGQSLDASPAEAACMRATEERVSTDLRRTTKLTFLTVATASGSFFTDEIRGTAKLPDGRGVDFACSSERLSGSITEVDYRLTEARTEQVQQERYVRCESRNNQRRECPVDTSGGVTLVRQRSRTPCQENVNWGYTDRGIWVDRGCRADFRAMELNASESPGFVGSGAGFLHQQGSEIARLGEARLECGQDGAARLTLSSSRDEILLSGICYPLTENRIKLALTPNTGDWYAEGGGDAVLENGALIELEIAGRSRYGQPFSAAFRAGAPEEGRAAAQAGEGLLEVADGRRATATAVRIDPRSDGRVDLQFEGQARFSFTGTLYPTWEGGYEVTIDGGLNDTTTRGAGTVRWSPDGAVELELAGTATTVGGGWRVTFDGVAGSR